MSQGLPVTYTEAHAAENTLLLRCCRDMVNGSEARPQTGAGAHEHLDWDYLCRRAQQHGIGPIACHSLKTFRDDAALPLAVLEKLKKFCMTALIVNRKLLDIYANICDAFRAEQIPLIPYKGVSFLLDGLYPAIDLRPMTDIDILVKKDDMPGASAVLERMGFHSTPHNILFRDRHFHLTFTRKVKQSALVVELHWHVDFSGSPFALRIEDVWRRARQHDARSNVYALDIHDDLLLNLYHLLRDPDQDKVVPLKNCVDIALLIKRHREAIDWDLLRQRAADYSLQRMTDFVLALLEHLSLTDPGMRENSGQRGMVPHELIEKLVSEKIFPDMQQEFFLPEGLLVATKTGGDIGLNVKTIYKTVSYHLINEYGHQGSFTRYLLKIIADFRHAVKNYFVVVRAMIFNRRLFRAVKEKKIKRNNSLRSIEEWLQCKG